MVTDEFAKNAGAEVMEYLRNRVYPGEVMNGMLVYMDENQAEGSDAAGRVPSRPSRLVEGVGDRRRRHEGAGDVGRPARP